LEIVDLRGNVPTRLEKLTSQGLDAIVLARAGLERLGYTISGGMLKSDAGEFHATPLGILPAIGQGAIGIEIRRDDAATREVVSAIDHPSTHVCVRVERELLRRLDGDCRLPVAALARLEGNVLSAEAIVFADDETLPPARARATGPASDPEAVVVSLFEQLQAVNQRS
jgi:porphobilinogen deaminase